MNTRWAWTDLASLVWIPVKVPRSILPPKPQNVVTVFFKQTEKTVWFLEQSFHCHFRSFDRNEKSVLKSSVFNEDHNNSWYLNRNARFFLKTRISALNHVTVNDVTVNRQFAWGPLSKCHHIFASLCQVTAWGLFPSNGLKRYDNGPSMASFLILLRSLRSNILKHFSLNSVNSGLWNIYPDFKEWLLSVCRNP